MNSALYPVFVAAPVLALLTGFVGLTYLRTTAKVAKDFESTPEGTLTASIASASMSILFLTWPFVYFFISTEPTEKLGYMYLMFALIYLVAGLIALVLTVLSASDAAKLRPAEPSPTA